MSKLIAERFYNNLKRTCCVDADGDNPLFHAMIGDMDKLLYNYCKLKYLWQYFDKETISPGHQRFSNDYREFEFGLEVAGNADCDAALYDTEAFFFCLIGKADARSMWSEYCNDEQAGVCIGYDFKRPNYRYPDFISAKSAAAEKSFALKSKCDIWPFVFEIQQIDSDDNKTPLKDGNNLMFFAGPRHVIYTHADDSGLGAAALNCSSPNTVYSRIFTREASQDCYRRLGSEIHYIKHYTFSEEDEYRILFHLYKKNKQLFKLLSKQGNKAVGNGEIGSMRDFFSYSDGDLGKNPRLIVKCKLSIDEVFRTGSKTNNYNCCRYLAIDDRKKTANKKSRPSRPIHEKLIVRGYTKDNVTGIVQWDEERSFIDKLKLALDTYISSLGLGDGASGTSPIGTVDEAEPRYIVLGQGEDQKTIYEAVDKHLVDTGVRKKFKIWCNGHPPIRKVIVECCENTHAIVESIRRYCFYIWWLKDVDVVPSAIPHRKSRNKSHRESQSE